MSRCHPAPPAERTVRIGRSTLDADMSAARARLRSAIAEGARTAELEVTHLRTYPSATFGAVADRVPCLLRVPLADIVDAETYGDALTRAGADLVASP